MANPSHIYEVLLIMNRQEARAEVTRLSIVHETPRSYFTGKNLKNQRAFSKQGTLKRIKVVTSRESRYTGYVFNEDELPD
jgi:hypothetical protein